MTNAEAMLAAVRANPDDDTARLVYADALEEAGDTEGAKAVREQLTTHVVCPCWTWNPTHICTSCDGSGWARRCQHEDCRAVGYACGATIVPEDIAESEPEPDTFLCTEHATEHGYCWRCGGFFAGIESFDFNRRGLCDGCQDEVDADEREIYEDDADEWEDDRVHFYGPDEDEL